MNIKDTLSFLIIVIVVMLLLNKIFAMTSIIKNKEVSHIISIFVGFSIANFYQMFANGYIGSTTDQLKIALKTSLRPTAVVGIIRYMSDFVIPKQDLNMKYIVAIFLGYFADSLFDKM